MKWKTAALAAVGITLMLAGCSKGSENGNPVSKQPEELVTLKVLVPSASYLTDKEFEDYLAGPVKARYPHITLESLTVNTTIEKLSEMLSRGDYPDLIIVSSNLMAPLHTVGLTMNMEPLLQSGGVELGQFEAGGIQATRVASKEKGLAALPYNRNFSALYYNKDLFDKFGVGYPKDGMTWQDTIELAQKMTRTDGGVNYRGLHAEAINRSASQLSLGFVDPKTSKASLQSDKWKLVFETHKHIYDIPGNEWVAAGQAKPLFTKDRILAMFAINNQLGEFAKVPELNWDIASYPTYREAPGKGMNYDLHVVAVTEGSKHKEEAMKAAATLVSEETQLQMARNGRISVLKDKKSEEAFGASADFLKGKNIAAIFKTMPADNYVSSEYDVEAINLLRGKISTQIFKQGVDINTALRQAEEEINQIIGAASGK